MIIEMEDKYGVYAYNLEYLLKVEIREYAWRKTGEIDDEGEDIKEPIDFEIRFIFNADSYYMWKNDGVNKGYEEKRITGFHTREDAKALLDKIFEAYENGVNVYRIGRCKIA